MAHNKEIFIDICKEKRHSKQLEFYCKNHNKLCCAACITKLETNGYGQHKDCDVCVIQDIKEEKKNKLKDNIKYLEDLSNNLNNSIKELKQLFDKIEEKNSVSFPSRYYVVLICKNTKSLAVFRDSPWRI